MAVSGAWAGRGVEFPDHQGLDGTEWDAPTGLPVLVAWSGNAGKATDRLVDGELPFLTDLSQEGAEEPVGGLPMRRDGVAVGVVGRVSVVHVQFWELLGRGRMGGWKRRIGALQS